jgi:hypothetical protein
MPDHTMNMQGVQITWLGHATFKITSPQGKVILIDPWTQGNPACPDNLKQIDRVDIMLVTLTISATPSASPKPPNRPLSPLWNWRVGSHRRV